MKILSRIISIILIAILSFNTSIAQESKQTNPFADTTKVYRILKFDIKEEIAAPIWRMTQKAFDVAKEENVDLIIIDMNTYGGGVLEADSMRTKILESKIPVVVFVNNNAASAGALISIACDSIYMRKGSNIGAATVVNQNAEAMPDKYQSYMRSMMRSTAETKGRDPDIAQAMVDPDVYVENVSDSGKVLTFTSSEAIENGFCEGEAESIQDVIEALGIHEYEMVEMEITATDRLIGFLISPMISGLLIMVIIGGIYFELQTPGIGFPLGAAVVAAILYFAPHYIEGLAEHWEVALFFVGLILLAVEIFAIPGFGVAGILGILALLASLSLSMVGNVGLTFPEGTGIALIKALFIVIVATLAGVILTFYLGHRAFTTNMFGRLALESTQQREAGFVSSDIKLDDLEGQEGIANTILRPSGKVRIGNDVYDATATSGYIDKGEKVRVVRHESSQLFVKKMEA
jgi:membrane-bound serine protease (ClpP class)